MGTFRLKQIGLVLCLMASLLTAVPAACACSHHEETKAVETDCHSQHETAKPAEAVETGSAIDESCVCAVVQRTPVVASKTLGKDLKAGDAVAVIDETAADFAFVAVLSSHVAPAISAKDLSYSSTLRSLLPARAPPRL
ncbi:MAG: hypothetical protein ABL952_06425 [Pyrinomonadaceae bacterium]